MAARVRWMLAKHPWYRGTMGPPHRCLFGRQEDMAQGGGLVICPGSCDDFDAESVVSRAPGGPVQHPSLLKPGCPLLSDLGNEAVL